MKYVGFWNYDADVLAAWAGQAATALGPTEDAQAARDPGEPSVVARLQSEGTALRAALPSLHDIRKRCAVVTAISAHP